MRRQAFAISAIVALALLLPGSARATHGSGYWFYQGHLPDGGGIRSKTHQKQCCNSIQEIRNIWTLDSHYMRFVRIRYDGSWSNVDSLLEGGDETRTFNVDNYTAGGCQNPAGLSTVWVNCRVGNYTPP